MKRWVELGLLLTCVFASSFALPSTSYAHTINICWLIHGNGDVEFFAGTYHDPSQGLSGGMTVDGTRYNFTSSFGGNINTLALTNCQGGFNNDGTININPCNYSQPILHWQRVRVAGIQTGDHTLNITADSAVETPLPGCYPVTTNINVTDPCGALGDDDSDFTVENRVESVGCDSDAVRARRQKRQ